MTALLSAISGQFAKMILLGTFFPVVIMSILDVLLISPILPFATALQTQLRRAAIGEEKWSAVALTVVVLVLTGLLYNLNIPIIRLYEGYPWQKSWLGQAFLRRKKRKLRESVPLRRAIRALRRELALRDSENPIAGTLEGHQTDLALFLNSELPDSEELVLPTQLGNVIRCFERYPTVAYSMDAIALWPRLVAKIEPGFAATVDDAKTSFDFMLNFSFLSALTGLFLASAGLWSKALLTRGSALAWGWRTLFFFALAFVFYRAAIGRAAAWGTQIEAAFDLYRFELLKALGYQQQPISIAEERVLWDQISSRLLFADTPEVRPLGYKDSPTHVVASPANVQLAVRRQLGAPVVNGNVLVEIRVKNEDSWRKADVVHVVDTIPEGYKYVWQSVSVSAGNARLVNSKPLEFELDPIAPRGNVTLRYSIRPA